MSIHTAARMDAGEIAAFLNARQTGVLALADGDDAYNIPVSYTYRGDDDRVYFRFGYAPGSTKREYVDATDHASFCVYDRTDDGWTSVVASGRLAELTADDLETSIVESVEQLRIPYYQVFDRPAEDLTFSIVALEIDSIHGLVEG